MADRPAQICQLKKGKFLVGQQGFVDTFNWAVQSIANLKGGENCEVSWTLPDHPTIDVTVSDEGGEGGGGDTSDAVVSMVAGSYNISAAIDSSNQDYLTYTKGDGTSTTIGLPYINAVADLSVNTDYYDDRTLNWTYTRNSTQGGPIDLGVKFTDTSGQNTTDVHSKFTLKSAQDSNVEFTFNGGEITVGVYYI